MGLCWSKGRKATLAEETLPMEAPREKRVWDLRAARASGPLRASPTTEKVTTDLLTALLTPLLGSLSAHPLSALLLPPHTRPRPCALPGSL